MNTDNRALAISGNAPICEDQRLPAPKRISSCTLIIGLAQHGSSVAQSVLATIYLGRALAFQDEKNDQAALQDFGAAAKVDPRSDQPWLGLGNFYAAKSDCGDAIADFTRAISLDPHDLSAYSNRATCLLASNRLDLAIADLTEIIRAEPNNGSALYDRGTAYERTGKLDEALDDYRRAIELDPKSPALRSRALLYLSLGRPERALPDLDRVIANNGSDGVAYADRGVVKAKLGDLKGAIGDYGRSLELAPTVAVYVDRGNAYVQLHQEDEGLADFNAALKLEPRNPLALGGRAEADYASKRFSESLEDYNQVIGVDPRNAIAYFRRGNIYLDRRNWAAALSDYSKSLELSPNQPAVLYNRSIAEARLGRRDEAGKDQRRARQLSRAPPDTER